MKLYVYDGHYQGGIAIVAESREEASRILDEAKIHKYYGDDNEENPNWSVSPSSWTEKEFNKPALFHGDR